MSGDIIAAAVSGFLCGVSAGAFLCVLFGQILFPPRERSCKKPGYPSKRYLSTEEAKEAGAPF